jgi:hypothetical protein
MSRARSGKPPRVGSQGSRCPAGRRSPGRGACGRRDAVAVVVGIAVVVALFDRILLANQVPFERSPAVLEDRAQEIIRRLGYAEPPADTATGLVVWMDPLRWIARTDSAPNRWERLRTASPPGILFWYRESPHPLVPNRRSGLVSFADPPMTSAGMVSVILDPRGRLLELHAVPPRRDDNAAAPVASDVDALFTAAGLDRSRFVEVEPTVTPRAFADSRAAWEGAMSDDASTKVRVETGTYRGRPIQFQIVAPWTQLAAGQQALAPGRGEQLLGVLEALVVPGLLVVGAVMARRNLLRGRGDRRGAAAAGLFVLVTSIAAWALAATHASGIDTEIDRLFNVALASALFSAANLWVWYIALEPYVRRFWPNALLGWARLVAGHVRDPRVGLEVLAGAACGTLMTLIFAAHDPLAPVIGGLAPIPQVRARSAARHTVRSRIPPRKLARGVAQRNDRSVRSRVLPGDVQAAALDRLLAGHDRLHTGGPPGNVPRGSGPPWRSRWRLPSWARS